MAEEIQEAVQIIRVAYDGIDIAVKIGSGMIGQIKEALDFMVALLEHEKVMGKENIKKLLMKGGDLQVLQFATEDMGKVKKLAKKYGLLYSVLPHISLPFLSDFPRFPFPPPFLRGDNPGGSLPSLLFSFLSKGKGADSFPLHPRFSGNRQKRQVCLSLIFGASYSPGVLLPHGK